MSRYIDADNLHNAKFQNTDGYGENVAYRVGWNEAIEAIEENEPTAIDIVRCRECRYKDMDICPMYRLVVAGVRKYDDFCSYGERRADDE